MATGYTHNIKDGITFRKFALNCARNFGATIALRDESSDVEVTPENVKFGSDYHKKQLSLAKSAKAKFRKLNQAQKRVIFKAEMNRAIDNCRQSDASMKAQKKKYLAMLEKVEKWTPPTKEHKNMKDFMVSQIDQSVDFDCNPKYNNERIVEVVTKSYSEWLAAKKEELNRDIEYHEEELANDTKRDTERPEWVKNLIDSLPQE